MRGVSREFGAAMAGIAVTLLAWVGPWAWPAWPALVAVRLAFPPERSFAVLPLGARAAIVVALVALNVAVWGVVAFVVTASGRYAAAKRRT